MTEKLLLGLDIGSSSIKASLLHAESGALLASATSPEREMKIDSPQPGWAEQHPETWWEHVVRATHQLLPSLPASYEILGIGISYQMHGLVLVDRHQTAIHPAIIWCDSRAVEAGEKTYAALGSDYCQGHCLNSPGNFTAAKLKWVRENLPDVYAKIHKAMLPGDFIAMKLTGEIRTTVSGLSEGIFWDFREQDLAGPLLAEMGIDPALLAERVPTFGEQGRLGASAAAALKLPEGIPVTYRAGDQPNNALSLKVMNPGEVATTAGTSGVVYGVTNRNLIDPQSRVNAFAHVNYTAEQPNVGILLCINGTGIQYSWLKQTLMDGAHSYGDLNEMAGQTPIGAEGLLCLPFGNGAERILANRDIRGGFSGINFNIHSKGHMVRAAQEGIAFSFRYGLDIMKDMGMAFSVIRAGNSNLFQSPVFREAFVNTCNVGLEIYNTDGSQGAARGAGIGAGFYRDTETAFRGLKVIDRQDPEADKVRSYQEVYHLWKARLEAQLADR
ncbi:MAG: carbohydrate kinase [Calditrichaeota bacterium]|nr:carbohydrate kinase [Calditrichota bacterium]